MQQPALAYPSATNPKAPYLICLAMLALGMLATRANAQEGKYDLVSTRQETHNLDTGFWGISIDTVIVTVDFTRLNFCTCTRNAGQPTECTLKFIGERETRNDGAMVGWLKWGEEGEHVVLSLDRRTAVHYEGYAATTYFLAIPPQMQANR